MFLIPLRVLTFRAGSQNKDAARLLRIPSIQEPCPRQGSLTARMCGKPAAFHTERTHQDATGFLWCIPHGRGYQAGGTHSHYGRGPHPSSTVD